MSRQLDFNNLSDDDKLYALVRGIKIPEQVKEKENIQETESENKDYNELTIPELKDELDSRDLPTTGNKAELIARLVADDNKESE